MTHLIPNPLVDVLLRLTEDGSTPDQIEISAFSVSRGFTRVDLRYADRWAYDLALRFLDRPDDDDFASLRLGKTEVAALVAAGLIVAPEDRGPPIAQPCPPPAMPFARDGHAALPACVSPQVATWLAAHYRRLIATDVLSRGDRQTDRYHAYNDPAARLVQRALLPLVAAVVGAPVQSSFSYMTSYRGGVALPPHRDRPQCDPVLSLMIDYRPEPATGSRVPWPLELHVAPDAPPIELLQAIGDGVLFRGREIRHSRPALPDQAECTILLLNYVPADFAGSTG